MSAFRWPGLLCCAILLQAPWGWCSELLSFAQCVKEAAEQNPEIIAAQKALQATVYGQRGSYFNFFPQLSSALTFNYGNSSPSSANFTPSLLIRENLFNGFADSARIDLANANRASAQADLQVAKAKISNDLKTAFAGLVYAQDLLKLNESIRARRESNYKLVALRFDSGLENYGSVLLSKAYFSQAAFQISQAKDAVRTSSVQLSKVLGRPITDELRAEGAVKLTQSTQKPNFDELAHKTPTLLKSLAQENVAISQKDSARAALFPTLDLTSSTNINIGSNAPSNTQWLVGFTVNWPIFSGGRDYYSYKSALQTMSAAQHNRIAVQKDQVAVLAASYASFVEAIGQLEIDKSFLRALTVQSQIATEQYNNGLLNFQNWDQIESNFILREQTALASQKNRVLAESSWEEAMGVGVIP